MPDFNEFSESFIFLSKPIACTQVAEKNSWISMKSAKMKITCKEEDHKSVTNSVDHHHFRKKAAFEHQQGGNGQGERQNASENAENNMSMKRSEQKEVRISDWESK